MFQIDTSRIMDIKQEIIRLAPWSHYYKFDENTFVGFYQDIFDQYGRTYCMEGDDPEMVTLFRDRYEEMIIRWQRFFAPCRLVRKLAGDSHREWSVVDLACNDGQKAMYMSHLGLGRVHGVEFRSDCIARAEFVKSLTDLNTEFRNYPLSADIPDYADGLGQYDIVCSIGLLYHLVDHYQHILNLKAMTRRAMVMSSCFAPEPTPKTEDASIPYRSVTGVCVTPTKADIIEMLIRAGFKEVLELRYHPDMAPDSRFMAGCVYLVAFP